MTQSGFANGSARGIFGAVVGLVIFHVADSRHRPDQPSFSQPFRCGWRGPARRLRARGHRYAPGLRSRDAGTGCSARASGISPSSDKTTRRKRQYTCHVEWPEQRSMEELDRLIAIAGRCSGPAWDRLKGLRDHPLFEQIVEALQRTEGAILEHHIDRVLATLADPSPGDVKSQHPPAT